MHTHTHTHQKQQTNKYKTWGRGSKKMRRQHLKVGFGKAALDTSYIFAKAVLCP